MRAGAKTGLSGDLVLLGKFGLVPVELPLGPDSNEIIATNVNDYVTVGMA